MIEIQIYRARIGLHYSRQAKVKGLDYLNYFDFLVLMSLILIGGIEKNPGPHSDVSLNSSSSGPTFESTAINNKFSIVHYNIQSFSNKLDLIESELRDFDVICLTETWLDQRISDETLKINGFNLYRRVRTGDNHGGFVFMLVGLFSLLEGLILNFHKLNVFGLKYQCITERSF